MHYPNSVYSGPCSYGLIWSLVLLANKQLMMLANLHCSVVFLSDISVILSIKSPQISFILTNITKVKHEVIMILFCCFNMSTFNHSTLHTVVAEMSEKVYFFGRFWFYDIRFYE